MSPGIQQVELSEVRLRYRPVGDVLTVTVRSGAPPGHRFRTELDDDAVLEWVVRSDGSRQMVAIQLIGARSRATAEGTIADLPEALRGPAHDLIDPGHRHHFHPSAHRPTTPLTVHEATVEMTADGLALDTPTIPEPTPPT